MNNEPEINTLKIISNALKDLNPQERKRIIKWAKDRFGVTRDKPPSKVLRTGKIKTGSIKAALEFSAVQKSKITEEKAQKTVTRVRKKKIKDFETVLDLFSTAVPKTSTEKVVLMAAYLQEKQAFQEITPYDISFRLKRINYGVSNTSYVISEILKRKPSLMVEIKTEDQTKSSRKKLRLTRKGLKDAFGFLYPGNS